MNRHIHISEATARGALHHLCWLRGHLAGRLRGCSNADRRRHLERRLESVDITISDLDTALIRLAHPTLPVIETEARFAG